MLDFPDHPTDGQVWRRWRWDGAKWTFAYPPAQPEIGFMLDWPTDTAPDNWVICDGRALDRWVYAELFRIFRTDFGDGNRRTTFNVPDLRDRITLGLDPDDTGRVTVFDDSELWNTGGSEKVGTHSHVVSGEHTHTLTDPGHAHGVNQWTTHGHTYRDPGHAHGVAQSPHSHALSDPGHGHGKPDPSHSHIQGHSFDARAAIPGNPSPNWYQFITGGNVATHADQSQSWNDASGTGVNCLADWVPWGIEGAGTGLWCAAQYANLDNYAAATGIVMDQGVTGITGIAENVDGTGGNIQPVLTVAKIIYAGRLNA